MISARFVKVKRMEIKMTKYNSKAYKVSAYTLFIALAVVLGFPSESNASWMFEEAGKFAERKVRRPVENTVNDFKTKVERSVRGKPDDPLDYAEQVVEDYFDDGWKVFTRKVLTPLKDFLEDLKL